KQQRETPFEQGAAERLPRRGIVQRHGLLKGGLTRQRGGELPRRGRRRRRTVRVGEHEQHHARLGFARQRAHQRQLRRPFRRRQQIQHVGGNLFSEIEPQEARR